MEGQAELKKEGSFFLSQVRTHSKKKKQNLAFPLINQRGRFIWFLCIVLSLLGSTWRQLSICIELSTSFYLLHLTAIISSQMNNKERKRHCDGIKGPTELPSRFCPPSPVHLTYHSGIRAELFWHLSLYCNKEMRTSIFPLRFWNWGSLSSYHYFLNFVPVQENSCMNLHVPSKWSTKSIASFASI